MNRPFPVAPLSVVLLFAFLLPPSPSLAADLRHTPVVAAVAASHRAVVNIRTERLLRRANPFFGFSDPLFEEFFRGLAPPVVSRTQAVGSGFIFDGDGLVLTNNHVVERASRIFVAVAGRPGELEAEVVGRTDYLDLAVLRLPAGGRPYPAVPLGTSADLMLGETVIAMGNPLGLGHSITTGVVSARDRRLPLGELGFLVCIQTDALINPGNSGGPLVNLEGKVVGINTAIVQQAQGIGFAVPVDAVRRVLPDLLEHGRLRPVYHGILPGEAGPGDGHGGVLVEGVDDNGPAAAAGLAFGDVITAVDTVAVSSPAEFQVLLRGYIPGNTITLTVARGFDTLSKTMRLAPFPPGYGLAYGRRVYGLEVADTGGQGVEIRRATGPAAKRGLTTGDRIVRIGEMDIAAIDDYEEAIRAAIGFEPQQFLVARGRRGYLLSLP